MFTLLMILFIFLCFFLAVIILIQQGKGDLGVGSMSGSQMLFGGSGGQGFFEKTTWAMGALFIFGSLGLAMLKSKEVRRSVLDDAIATATTRSTGSPVKPVKAGSHDAVQDLDSDQDQDAPLQDVTPSTNESQDAA